MRIEDLVDPLCHGTKEVVVWYGGTCRAQGPATGNANTVMVTVLPSLLLEPEKGKRGNFFFIISDV